VDRADEVIRSRLRAALVCCCSLAARSLGAIIDPEVTKRNEKIAFPINVALQAEDPASADVARLRLFAGLSIDEAADALGVSRATAFRDRSYARAWLTAALSAD
jgi:predicted DNA-binding protein (UPF0251 family)